MTASVAGDSKKATVQRNRFNFSEMAFWKPFDRGWRKLHGNFRQAGYSVEWHDFTAREPLDWSKSFHPESLEICLNLCGHGEVRTSAETLELGPLMAGFYAQNRSSL